jgi:hypothetical protein
LTGARIDLGHRVTLNQILRRIADAVDHAEIGLQDRVAIPVAGLERELIGIRCAALPHVVSGSDVNLIAHVVIEVVLVRTNPWFLVWIHGERRRQVLAAKLLRHERIDVSRVRGIVQSDERRIHVTGRPGRS